MNASLRRFAIWVVLVLLLLAVFTFFEKPARRSAAKEIAFSEFLDLVDRGSVRAIDIQGSDIQVFTIYGGTFTTVAPYDAALEQRLRAKGVVIAARPSQPQDLPGRVEAFARSWLPIVFLVGVGMFLYRWMRRGRAAPLDAAGPASPPTALDDPAHWRARGGEARLAAEQSVDPESQRQMLEIAQRYEYLARRAEERRRGPGS